MIKLLNGGTPAYLRADLPLRGVGINGAVLVVTGPLEDAQALVKACRDVEAESPEDAQAKLNGKGWAFGKVCVPLGGVLHAEPIVALLAQRDLKN